MSGQERYLFDVNTAAILMVQEHPGHEYIYGEVMSRSADDLVYNGYLAFRAYWVLTSQWGYDESDAAGVVKRFIDHFPRLVCVDRETVRVAFEIAEEKDHDVFDCFFVALARQHSLDGILSTDRDFEDLCRGEDFVWWNPVPEDVLEEFSEFEPI